MDTFVARQPIFDANQKVFAYELLFRSGFENIFKHHNMEEASMQLISDSLHLIGLDTLTMGKKAFINFPESLLLKQYISILPKDDIVIEILEDVKPTSEVLASCSLLKRQGFTFALDDFIHNDQTSPFLNVSTYIKVDFRTTPFSERKEIAEKMLSMKKTLIAEKVETIEEFEEARKLGYQLFQGYFFCKPTIISRKKIPSFKLNLIQIYRELFNDEINYDHIERLILQEVSLPYKLLRYVNSPYIGRVQSIKSIRQAMLLLGNEHFRRWLSLVMLTDMGQDKPNEIVVNAIIRGKFCEMLAGKTSMRGRSTDLFFLGMFSILDVLIGRPFSDILSEIPIDHDIKDALLGVSNPLRDVFEIVMAYEKLDWDSMSAFAQKTYIQENAIPELYVESVEWANNIFYNA